jgi:uncharacterized protein
MKDFLLLDWDMLVDRVKRLADMIKESGEEFNGIVTAACGGLAIASILHDLLGIPVASYTANSYTGIGAGGKGKYRIQFQLGGKLKGDKVLFVDDVAEHGGTFMRGLEHLEEWGTTNVKTATLFLKPHSKFTPDYVVEEVDEWVIFPFEFFETVRKLHKKWSEEGLPTIDIWLRLNEIGIPHDYISRYAQENNLLLVQPSQEFTPTA